MRQSLTIAFLLTTLLPAAALAQPKVEESKCTADANCKSGQACKAGACVDIPGAKPAEPPPEDKTAAGKDKTDPGEPPSAVPVKITDVEEKPGKTYYFIGLRYRGTVVPQFMMNLFVDGGRTVWNNAFGIEMDVRKDGFSIIPSLVFAEHGMAPSVFLEKGKDANLVGNYTVVGSDVKGVYANVDLLWSAKLHKNVDFEYGFGVGVGVLFGDLTNNWVKNDPNGPYKNNASSSASAPQAFSYCSTPDLNAGVNGCTPASHNNSTVNKVLDANGKPYTEKYWTDGGPLPNVFLHLALPILGVRIKPIKQFVFRFNTGFSITGFFFNFAADYGLESMPKTSPTTAPPKPKAFLGPYQGAKPQGFYLE